MKTASQALDETMSFMKLIFVLCAFCIVVVAVLAAGMVTFATLKVFLLWNPLLAAAVGSCVGLIVLAFIVFLASWTGLTRYIK